MHEALTVWNPFGDELLDLWLESVADGRVASYCPEAWRRRAALLRDEYESLTALHQRCTKHGNPKENLGILVHALDQFVRTEVLEARLHGLLQHAVDSMVRRRGRPGSAEHRTLRERQAANAATCVHHRIARVVASRLALLPPDSGLASIDDLIAPITAEEAASSGVPEGTRVPPSIIAVVRLALARSVETLVGTGMVPSAEVLARLVPHIAAGTVAAAYEDETLQQLVAQHHLATSSRTIGFGITVAGKPSTIKPARRMSAARASSA